MNDVWNEQQYHRKRAHSFSGHTRSPAMHLGRVPSPNPLIPAMRASARQPSPVPPASSLGPGGFIVPPQASSQRLRTPSPMPREAPISRDGNKLTKSHKHSSNSKSHNSRTHTSSHHHHSHSHSHVQTHTHHSHKHGHKHNGSQTHIPQAAHTHSNPYPVVSLPSHRPHRRHSATQINASSSLRPQQYIPNPQPALQMPTPHKPPATVQRFGPEYEGPDHRRQHYTFQYSQCNRRKKALCIGINYRGMEYPLNGCINDAKNVRRFLIDRYGYKREDIVMLTDEGRTRRERPTKQNILDAMRWLVKDAQPHDSLFFHFSGHGAQVPDKNGDELDGYDEVIYPLDYKKEGSILDDDMHMIMVRPLPRGCRLTAIFDSCHSGTALDLPYIYTHQGKIKEPDLALQVASGMVNVAKSYRPGDIQSVVDAMDGMMRSSSATRRAQLLGETMRMSSADVISWSGCKDSQKSNDLGSSAEAVGAMSSAFIKSLTRNPEQSYQQLLKNLRNDLKRENQKPQLCSSHPMDTSLQFIC